MRIKFYAMFALIALSGSAWSQKVTVKSQGEKVKGENGEGFTTELDGKMSEVNLLWSKFLKELGRVKLFSTDPMIITGPNFNGTVYPKGIVYGHIFENGNQTRVWLGMLSKEWDVKDVVIAKEQLEKLIYQFGIRFYREKAQQQIDQAQQAADAVERQKQRLINQNADMVRQLANNEEEQEQLAKSMENNKLERETLKIRIERNKKEQDSLANAVIQIKKVIESHKETQRKIN